MLFYLLLINIIILYVTFKNDSYGFLQGLTTALCIFGSIIFWAGVGISKLL